MRDQKYYPSYEEFERLSESANLVPVYREILADLETPVSALWKIDDGSSAFLLESVEAGRLGRYSFIGANPSVVIQCKDNKVRLVDGMFEKEFENESGDPLDRLKEVMSRYKAARLPSLPSFHGGAVGYLGYDMVRYFENIPLNSNDDLNLPDMLFMITDSIVIFDHVSHTMKVVANAHVTGNPEKAYEEAVEQIDFLIRKLNAPLRRWRYGANMDSLSETVVNRSKEDYCEAVERAREYIVAGDIFQAIVSLRQEARVRSAPIDIYRALRTVNPSPYMFYLKHQDTCLIGSSPEILVKLEKDRVRYRPLAGTRWRGKTEEEDRQIAQELLEDPKERAEHVMLIDLGRNDIGRVCKYNTVTVDELMTIERYSHVMHIVSNVTGLLRDDYSAFDLMRAVFPAGTVSGAPKVRAMQIIDELEPTRRGPYGGAVGYFGFSGDLDSGIILRTILMKGSTAYVQSGAGIVYDSNPEYEYNECMNKGRGLMKAIELAETSTLGD